MICIIKVLQVISGNDNGGGAKHVINICNNNVFDMKSSIATIGKGYMYDSAIKNNIETENFSFREIIGKKFIDYLVDKNIDIVNFHGAKSNFVYFLIHNKLHIPCVVTIHSDYRYDFLNNKFKRYVYTPLSKAGLRKFHNYICVSDCLKELLEHKGFKGSKYIVNNGVDFKDFKVNIEADNLKKKLNIGENDFVYVMVARMHPIKNHEKLIRAFYLLQKKNSNVKLILVGNGELEDHLKEMVCNLKIENKVIFAGFRENVFDFINLSDISILTSLNEGGIPPIVILESAILKKSVICSRIGNMSSIIDRDSGYLINPNDERDILNAMNEAYENKENLNNMGKNLYNNIKKKFSLEEFWKRYYFAYLHILHGVK
ncbi:glycosyltransferase family 4 protein [Clostridium sp. cel8]|uniref:glycosyltransferase family 4 protein n=1 Tax=unclassified Clostridium TaxID=2614128 RepID=UPI00325FA503